MSSTTKGYLCGVVAAVSYGTNPLGALWLYEDGLTPYSVLLYRFAVGIMLILSAVIIIVVGRRLSVAQVTAWVNRMGRRVVKHWRWR